MEQVNVTPPGDEFKKMIQDFVIELTQLRYDIDDGKYKLITRYRNLLNRCYQNVGEYGTDDQRLELAKLSEKTFQIKGLRSSLNMYNGKIALVPTDDIFNYLKELDKFESILRTIMKSQNFLVKTIEKRVRLT